VSAKKERPHPQIRIIIVSGLSGSGKSTAIRALEDLGFFCMDNLPVVLLEQMVTLCEKTSIGRLAVVIDVRERAFLGDYQQAVARVRDAGYQLETLFLTCSDEVLIQRFKETRRRHPLQGPDQGIADGIAAEHEALFAIRSVATRLVDSSRYNVHQLTQRIQALFGADAARKLAVHLMSFGFKHGLPAEADFVFDVRFLANPYFVPELKHKSGLDEDVADYVMSQEGAGQLVEILEKLLTFVFPQLTDSGRTQVTIAIGCTGGQHRSVAVTQWLASQLPGDSWHVTTLHRDAVP